MSAYSDLILSDSPRFYLRLNEPSGATAQDSSPNNIDGTYFNTPGFSAAGLITADADTAVNFNGSDEYVIVNDTVVNPTAVTAECWMTADTLSRRGLMIAMSDTTDDFSYRHQLYIQGTDDPGIGHSLAVNWRVHDTVDFTGLCGGPGICPDPTDPGCPTGAEEGSLVTARRYHVVATAEIGQPIKLYIDGCLECTGDPVLSDLDGWGGWRIARGSAGPPFGYFDGVMDEVAVYHYALDAGQVQNHFTIGSNYLGTDGEGCFGEAPVPETCSLLETDDVLLVDATYQDVNVTLMDPAPIVGHVYYVKRIDMTDNTVTLDPGSLLIDGMPSLELEPWDAVALVTTGYEWHTV